MFTMLSLLSQVACIPTIVTIGHRGHPGREKAGLPVVRGKKMLPLDRQVQITAGTMALAGFALGEFVNSNWFLLAGFVGCGLVFAGVTGFCPLGGCP